MSRDEELAERRALLLARSELLRARMQLMGGNVRDSLGGIDKGIGIARSLGSSQMLMTGLTGLFTLWRPKGMFKWVSRLVLARSVLGRIAGPFLHMAVDRLRERSRPRPRRESSRESYFEEPWGGQPRDY